MKLQPFCEIPSNRWLAAANAKQGRGSVGSPRSDDAVERERVRQWLLREFIDTLGYPADWIGTRIVLRESAGFFGFLITDAYATPFLAVSVGKVGTLPAAENTLRELMSSEATVLTGVAADGSTNSPLVLRRNSYSGELGFVPELDAYVDPRFAGPNQRRLFGAKEDARQMGGPKDIAPFTANVESLFFELHSVMRDIDALHADEALDELCKVLFAKMYDEQTTKPGDSYRLQRWLYGSFDELACAVRRVYDEARDSLSGQLDQQMASRTEAFRDPVRLSSSALARVVEGLQDYSITKTPTDLKGRAFQQVIGPATRAGMGQYFTPNEIIDLVIDCVQPNDGESVLDPFCGSAHFLTRASDRARGGAMTLRGIEKNERMVRVATIDAAMHAERGMAVTSGDALLQFSNYRHLAPSSFDVVVTNPPFGSLLGPDSLRTLGQFELANGASSVALEIVGLERCIQFLKPGGRLGIVLPEGVLANARASHVRKWLDAHAKIRAVISLPVETFSPFGANVKTCVLLLRKWLVGENKDASYKVCMAQVTDVGYEATGRPTGRSDVQEAAQAVTEFLRTEGW
jgi:type I restriction enzyme M protein